MAFQLSPGVNVTEKDLTTIVPAVATTNAAFAGIFNWGPVDKRVLIDSENNLAKLFGLPDNSNYQYWFSAANFLKYGNNLQVARTLKNGTSARNAVPCGSTLSPAASGPFAVLVRNEDFFTSAGATTNGPFIARYPGALGNSIEVQMCGSLTAASNFNVWTYANQFSSVALRSAYAENLGGTADEFHLAVIDRAGLWTGTTGAVLETFSNLSLDPYAQDIQGNSVHYRDKINTNSRYIFCPTTPSSFAAGFTSGVVSTTPFTGFKFEGATGTSNVSFGVARYVLGGGVDETAPTSTTGFMQLALNGTGGYNLFADSETTDVNLIIAGPEYQPSDTTVTSPVASSLKDIAESRKDCVVFCSAPISDPSRTEDDKLTIAKNYRNAIGSSSYVFIDSGYKYMYDVYNDVYRWVPLNGDIAGLCARTDANTDPWFSPAGFNRGQVKGVVRLAFNPSQTYRDELYRNNINPVVTFAGEGTILYGDKTAQQKPSAFDRINVRRLFIVLEKAIATASKYSLFEFNDAFTRAQFRSLVEPFLRDVQARRGIIDYKVVCDEKNNTPEVIDSNRFVADIYIKPARSINFIQLNFIATRTGVSFSEVGA
jgi:phage tail sheath protein FI